jgi:hypothetical protein
MRLLNRPIAMPSRLELHHTNVHRFGTSPVCQRTVSTALRVARPMLGDADGAAKTRMSPFPRVKGYRLRSVAFVRLGA